MEEEAPQEETTEEKAPEKTTEEKAEQETTTPAESKETQEEEKTKTQEVQKTISRTEKDNTIFVGIKPFMNYVTGVVMQFQNKGQDEVIVSARGKFISKAVDICEVARRTFLKDENIKVKDIKISSESFENKEGKRIHVSAIEIFLTKG